MGAYRVIKIVKMASLIRIRNCYEKFRYLNVLKLNYGNVGKQSSCLIHTTAPKSVVEINMPSLSPTMADGTIVGWQKKEGDTINPGDVLCEIQTDKAVMAFETEEEGTLAKIYFGDDSKDIKVGTLIALIAEPGEDWKTVSTMNPSSSNNEPEVVSKTVAANSTAVTQTQSERQVTQRPTLLGPAVRGLLERYGLSASEIPASGPHGLLLKGDVLSHIKENDLKPVSLALPLPPSPVPIIDKPSKNDMKPKAAVNKVQNFDNEQEYQDIELTSMRRTIAKRLTQSKTGIAHAYSTVDCKMDSLMKYRKAFKADGIKLSVNDFIIKAVGKALNSCPNVNVIWKGEELVQASSIDVSVAVATDSGLITPIVTDVTRRGLQEISMTVRDLADRARQGKLKLHEFQGGCFTISNLGMYGIGEFSAIINPPQCGILAIGGGRLAVGNDGKPMTVMSATLSYDEEAVSSVDAAKFMSTLQSLLESPQSLLL